MKAAIYARYSSSGQREESIEGQVRECTDYINKCGYDLVNTYTDKALTGRTDKRPGFQRMIADAEKHLFDIVVCWKIDRFARNRYDSAIYKTRLRKCGVSVQYARETISDGAEGIILESVLEGFAEYYSANLAENVKRGNYESVSELKTMGKKYLGLTDENGHFAIDRETAPIVQEIFERYAAGESVKSICDDLNRRGKRNRNGNVFDKSGIVRILKNERYAGTYLYGDFRQENAIPAIVSPELFNACRTRLNRHKHAPRYHTDSMQYLLTGKLVCNQCGALLTGESADNKKGSRYFYYTCQNKKQGKCSHRRMPKEETEKRISAALVSYVQDDEFISHVADICMEEIENEKKNSRMNRLLKEKAETEKKIRRMYDAIASGLNAQTAIEYIQNLESDLQRIDDEITEEQKAVPEITRDDVINLLKEFRMKPDEADSRYIQRLIETFLISAVIDDTGGGYMIINAGNGTERAEFSGSVRSENAVVCLTRSKRTDGFSVIVRF